MGYFSEPTITRNTYTVQQIQTVSGPLGIRDGLAAHLVTVELGAELSATFSVAVEPEGLGACHRSR